MNALKLSIDVRSTIPGCRLAITLDNDRSLLDLSPGAKTKTYTTDLDPILDGPHELQISLSGKTSSMTVVDHNNEIIKDSLLEITKLEFGDVDITSIFLQNNTYYHDLNGHSPVIIKDRFFGQMGCNGTVCLAFSAPIYIWLLENL